MSFQSTILPIIRFVFSRWTGLQLAVTHSMGGFQSDEKYEAFIQAFAEYLLRERIECDIQQYLEEILDEEFNTVLDDGSCFELAQLFHRYIQLISQGKLNEIENELNLQQTVNPGIQMSIRNENDESSSDECDEDMIEEEEEEEPRKSSMETDEDGWTTMGIFRFGQAEYSTNFFAASICVFISTLCCISAFASPYWTKRYLDTPRDFQNIGLWELCLYKYQHYKDDLQIPYTGCFWFWTNEMYRFRDWIIPPWFKWVQAFATLAFIFTIGMISTIAIGVFSSFRWQWKSHACWCLTSFIIVVFELIALCIYGVRSQDRLWMPRPEFNYLSYSYWFEVGSLIFALLACGLFAAEIQYLREPFDDYIDQKIFQQKYSPYSTSNDSRLQLTYGKKSVSQSEL